MKKDRIGMLAGLILIAFLTACGKDGQEGQKQSSTIVESSQKESESEKQEETKEPQEAEMELPNWKGAYADGSARQKYKDCGIDFSIQYPSLIPTTRSDFAYQMDPSLVMVGHALNNEPVDSLEKAFEVYGDLAVSRMDDFRNSSYTDFVFATETSEETTIHAKGIDFAGMDLPAIKYTGKHTYKKDGEECSIPFVAYAADLTVAENCYIFWIVCDDSINNPSMEPLPEGTIDAYALKMGESIRIDGDSVKKYQRKREKAAQEQ